MSSIDVLSTKDGAATGVPKFRFHAKAQGREEDKNLLCAFA
jgi:hypothetical protein